MELLTGAPHPTCNLKVQIGVSGAARGAASQIGARRSFRDSILSLLATALNRRLLDNFNTNSTDQSDSEIRVPANVFFRTDVLASEKEALFRNIPQPVAFSAEIPREGNYLSLSVLDIPVLLTRDSSGQIHAFINACSHRGAPVAQGSGNTRRLLCPFHGWSYSLEGALVGRPQDSCFDSEKTDSGLTRLPVSEKCGIVVVALHTDIPHSEVEAALGELEEEIGDFHLESYSAIDRRVISVRANWKLVNDLSLESYHFNVLHRDSVATVLASNAIVDTYNRESRWAFPLKSIRRLNDLEEADWPDAIEGSCTYTIFPGVMIIVNGSGAQMIRTEPGATPENSRVLYVGIAGPNGTFDEAEQAYRFGGEVFEEEDLPMAEQCQRGLEAGEQDLIIGKNEPLLQFWHRLWSDAL